MSEEKNMDQINSMKNTNDTNKKNRYLKNFKKCRTFFDEVAEILSEKYEIVGSCNKDLSAYLVPSGTADEITYHSKPQNSFRVSDHWNWYSNIKKCRDENYVQCQSVDLPDARARLEEGKASFPIKAPQVCLMFPDGKYHCVYGLVFDKKNNEWRWQKNDARKVAMMAENFLKTVNSAK